MYLSVYAYWNKKGKKRSTGETTNLTWNPSTQNIKRFFKKTYLTE